MGQGERYDRAVARLGGGLSGGIQFRATAEISDRDSKSTSTNSFRVLWL